MKIGIIGTGYVGLVTGACLAEVGHEVVCIDRDAGKIALLENGGCPIYEPGLPELIGRNRNSGRLTFSTRIGDGVRDAEAVFIAVGGDPADVHPVTTEEYGAEFGVEAPRPRESTLALDKIKASGFSPTNWRAALALYVAT